MKPRYQHDCDGCKFLGHHKEEDVYICESRLGRSIILRYGNDGSEYRSSLLFCCVDFTEIDLFALNNGLELTPEEEKQVIKILIRRFKDNLSFKVIKAISSDLVLGKGNIMWDSP